MGQPIMLQASVVSHGAVKETEIAIALPELALSHGDMSIEATGTRIRKAKLRRQSLQDRGNTTMSAQVVIDSPGIYRAVATVQTISKESPTLDGALIKEFGRDELWLLIDTKGSHVLRKADATSTPAGWATVPGPRKRRDVGGIGVFAIPCGDPGADPSCDPGGGGGPGGTYTLTTQWYNSDIGAYLPLKLATYTASDGTNNFTGATDEAGRLFLPCSYGRYAITVDYRSLDKTQIQRANLTIHALTYQTAINACATTPSEVVTTFDFNAAKVFDDMRTAVDSSRAFFQFTRSSVTVNLIDGAAPGEVSYYRSDVDKIWFKAGDIPGPRGIFVAAHEYGHALAQQAMNGSRGGGCPSSHFIDGYYTLQCALSEGFADYHAAAVRGADIGSIYYSLRSNGYYLGGDGSINEGAFAAFLLDVSARPTETDMINGVDYALHYPARYVGEQMALCQGFLSWANQWLLADGTDEIVYCLEGTVDGGVRANYFQTRYGYVVAEYTTASNPPGWNAAAIRRLWLRKLYGQ